MRASPERRITAWIALLVAGAVGACDVAGLEDVGSSLLDPDAALLDRPGRKLASGTYSSLLVDGSLETGGSVIAFRTDQKEPTVTIVPFISGEPCDIAPGVAFERVSSRVDVSLPILLAVQRQSTSEGRGDVSFVGQDCQPRTADLKDATMPRIVFPAGEPRGILAIDGDGTLDLVDPRSLERIDVARNVTTARVSGNRIFALQQGELVEINDQLEEELRLGSQVSGFALTAGVDVELAFQDQDGIHVWGEQTGERLISAQGCSPVSLGPDVVGYFEPCDERRLNIYAPGRLLGSDDDFATIVGPDDVAAPESLKASWGLGLERSEFIFLQKTDLEAPVGKLVMGVVARRPETSQRGSYAMELESLAEKASIERGLLYTDWNGSFGTLVAPDRNLAGDTVGLTELAQGVRQVFGVNPFSELGVLADFDGRVGKLVRLSKDDASIGRTVIATGVPPQSIVVEPKTGRFAFVAELDENGQGTLFLTNADQAEPIADQVFVDTARFLDQPRGLAYLSADGSAQFAELHAWLIDSGLDLSIQGGVSEYRTLPWPSPGILYAVAEGEDAGIWFSKAR